MYEGKSSDDYFGDDRIYEPGGLLDQIRSMTNEDLEMYLETLKKQEYNKE